MHESTNGQEITQTSPSPPQSRQKVGLFNHDLQRLTMSTRMRAFHKSCQVLQPESAADRQAEYQERWSISAISDVYNISAIKIMHLIDVVSSRAGQVPFLSKPMSFNLHFETLNCEQVPRASFGVICKSKITIMRCGHRNHDPTYMGSNAVFFQQRFLVFPVVIQGASRVCKNPTLVKWNWSGPSVLKLTFNPVLKKSGNGFLSYIKNNALLLRGLIAIPICLR
jgi:hypothetical protein